jgi:hypothetical protein
MSVGSINNTNFNLDQTVRIFDQFYNFERFVPAAEYDVVNSYFRSVMTSPVAAGNFTVALFQVAENTGIEPLTLLGEFQGLNGIELSANLAYYLNQIRSRAALLGLGVPVTPNYYAARNVLQ